VLLWISQPDFQNQSISRPLKGGPEPFEKEINKIFGPKREDRFSNPVFEVVQKTGPVRLSYTLRHGNLCKGPWTLRKFPQKCQKIARCQECAVYGSRPLIASKPGASPAEQPCLDNIKSQPWSDAMCPMYHRFYYFVSSFQTKRAWQGESKHLKRWYRGRFG